MLLYNIGIISADEQVKQFESRFHKLRTTALTEVENNGVTIACFRRTLMTLPKAISKENEEFLKTKYPLFEKAQTIESIFLHLNFYLSFIDFSLLEHIIEHFGSPSLKQQMAQYSRDIKMFRTETPVIDIIPHLSGRPKPPPHFTELEMNLDFDPKTCTLEDLEQHRKNFGREFSLSEFAIFLVKLEKGSLVAVWLIPLDIVSKLKGHIQQKSVTFFLKFKILELSINEECLYPYSTPKHDTVSISLKY